MKEVFMGIVCGTVFAWGFIFVISSASEANKDVHILRMPNETQ